MVWGERVIFGSGASQLCVQSGQKIAAIEGDGFPVETLCTTGASHAVGRGESVLKSIHI